MDLTFSTEDADVIVVNTCGFIESAKEESIDAILQYASIKDNRPDLKIVVAGCLSERYREELLRSVPEIDSAIGVRDPKKIVDAVLLSVKTGNLLDEGEYADFSSETQRELVFSGLYYAYLKISEGCDRNCAFCAIPSIRGKERSRPVEDILSEAQFLLDSGVRELILVGEDITSYGRELYGKKAIVDLIKRLADLDFKWIRLLYLFPDDIIYEIASLLKERDNLCNYIDIPLQHASGRVLRRMNRPGGMDEYINIIDRLRDINPDIAIRSAFIVGFPGETDEDFGELKEFLTRTRLNRAGFFAYSDEENTSAYGLDGKLNKRIINARLKEISALQESISRETISSYIGKTLVCINDGIAVGRDGDKGREIVLRSEYDAPEIDGAVYADFYGDIEDIDFVKVKINGVRNNYDLQGEIIDAEKTD